MALCELRYYSDALGKQAAANVILPDTGGAGPFPVLYLLHGLSDDYTIWLRRTSVERYVQNMPLIVVMPDGGRGFYSDAEQGYAYKKALAEELVDRIDRTFPTRAERSGRAVAGLSMGGYGALRFALDYPDRFCAAVSLSGALEWGHGKTRWDGRPFEAEWRRIFGDDPAGGPCDLYALAEQTKAAGALPALRVDCGVDDFLIEPNRAFHAHLNALGVPHEYDEFAGKHDWEYWDDHIKDALRFLTPHLDLNTATKDAERP